MINLSKFAEVLTTLMFDNGEMNGKQLAEAIGVSAPTVTQYLNKKHIPSVKNLILIANYFNCSTDFLLGLEPENHSLKFKECPPFSQQIEFLSKKFEKSFLAFYNNTDTPESSFFEWKNGSSLPTLESIKKLADKLGCRVDYVLGREV